MKALFFIICLVLSLPNLLAGLALAVLQHTFATRNPFQIIVDFVDSVAWGLPAAALVLLVLLVASFFTAARPYAALCALVLNIAVLVLFLIRIRPPEDLWEGVFFLPVLIAITGFAWLSYDDLSLKWRPPI